MQGTALVEMKLKEDGLVNVFLGVVESEHALDCNLLMRKLLNSKI